MYVRPNFKTKKALKEAVKAGADIEVFQPNDMFGNTPPTNGTISVEGPHFPKPHTWYARITITDGKITKVT